MALVIILVVGASIAGALVERVLMRRLHGASAERPVMVTLGLLVILTGVGHPDLEPDAPSAGGQHGHRAVPAGRDQHPVPGGADHRGGRGRGRRRCGLLFYSTRTGYALRAVVDDPELLAMSGASPNRMSQYGWILGFMMAALAGVLLAPTQTTGISIEAMTLLVVNGYAAAIVGRLKNIPVTFPAAIGIGLAENYVINYLAAPRPPEPGARHHLRPAHGVPVHRPGHPAVGAAAGRGPPDHRAGPPGGGRPGVAAWPAWRSSWWPPSWPLVFDNTAVPGAPPCWTLGGVVMTLGIVGLSLVLLTGYSGQVSLCQFSFMGIGAFVMGKVAGGGSLLGLVAATVVCAGIGALVALPTIRLRDLYLALATFAFADAVANGFFADTHIYGAGGVTVGRIVLPGLSFGGDRAEFLLVTVFFVLSAWMVLAIRRSLFGRRLVALNDSPAAYATVGLNIGFTKVAVFAIAAGMAGLAGALYGTVQGTVGTTDFDIFPGIIFVLFVTIWSIRTVTGAFLAALTYVVLNQLWPNGVGLFAGVGIILIGRAAGGILGIEALQCRAAVGRGGRLTGPGRAGAPVGGAAVLGGEDPCRRLTSRRGRGRRRS